MIGSQLPWIEAILLEKGANHVTTLDYGSIENHHPNVTVVLPEKLRKMYLNGYFTDDIQMFDAVVTFSSLEHSGLGRQDMYMYNQIVERINKTSFKF